MLSCIGVSAFIVGISVTINTGIDMYHNAADMVSDPHAVFARHMKHMGIMVKAGQSRGILITSMRIVV